MRPWTSVLLVVGLCGCAGSEDDVRFNADDTLDVEITAGPDLGVDVSTDLHSTTGAVVVGTATVSPGSGPVGTVHAVSVLVADDYADAIARVVVVTDAGERGVEEIALTQDSAEAGLWWRQVTSVGVEGETRTDTFTFELYTPAADTDGNGILP